MLTAMTNPRRVSFLRSVATVAVLVVSLAACGDDKAKPATGDDEAKVAGTEVSETTTAEETETEGDSDLPSDENIEAYFQAFADREPAALADALELAEPGSVAEAFLLYTISILDAALGAGFSPEDVKATSIEEIDGGWRVCNGEEEADCFDYTDVEGRGGKIVNFLADGNELNDRLTIGAGEPVEAGRFGTVTLRAAYHDIEDSQLNVVVDVTSGNAPITVGTFTSTYRGADGRQYTASSDSFGGSELGANSTTTVALTFTGATPGGALNLELLNEDYEEETATLQID